MTRVLVTGGAGFIGSHLVTQLLAQKLEVVVLDNLVYGQVDAIPQEVEFIHGDICDLATCHRAMRNVTVVFHCAAMSRVAPSMDCIDLCTQVNIAGTQNILLAARAAGVEKIIYSGSSTYYGNQLPPQLENNPPVEFLNTYALSKYVGEQYCLLFDKMFNVPCVILRYFNVYGPRQPAEGAYALVLGIFLRKKCNNEPLIIHGDGLQRRDFIHVQDVVAANIAAWQAPVRHAVFNIGSGSNISIKALADLISPQQIFAARRAYDAEETCADISAALQQLNWSPKITLQQGVQALLQTEVPA